MTYERVYVCCQSVAGRLHHGNTTPIDVLSILPDEQSSARFARSATYRLTVFFMIEIPSLPITFRYSPDEQSSARCDTYRLTVFFIIEIPCLSISFFARSLRSASDDGIFRNRNTLPIYSFFDLSRTSRAPLACLAPLPIG